MKLQSERLTLREITIDDIPWIHQLNSIPEVDRYNTLGLPKSITDTENIILPIIEDQKKDPRPRYVWLIQDAQQDCIGLTGMVMGKPNYASAEIWYKIIPSYWNNGFATEFVGCLLSFAFNHLKLHRLIAGCATQNLASICVLEKNGFRKESHHRKILPIRGEWVDNYEYAILEEDYFKRTIND